MKAFLKITTAAAALSGALALMGGSASAAQFNVGVGVGPVGFDFHSGGYCDRFGCPSRYWAYPIYYGPVFYDGAWFRGPVYTRVVDGEHWYWIHGAWHRDQWHGPRPRWARDYHYGPALGLDYYRTHGFHVSDRDWRAWNDRDRYRAYRAGYMEDRYRNGEDRYQSDRDWYRTHHQNYENRYREDRDQYEHTRYENGRDRGYDRDTYDRDHGYSDRERPMNTGYEQERGHPRTPPITGHTRTNSHSGKSNSSNPDRDQNGGPTE